MKDVLMTVGSHELVFFGMEDDLADKFTSYLNQAHASSGVDFVQRQHWGHEARVVVSI